jgi:hypothetical protein
MKSTRAHRGPGHIWAIPLLIATVALIPALMLARHLSARGIPSVEPTISLEHQQAENSSGTKALSSAPALPDAGEVYRTADRLRDASALALAATLYVSNQLINKRIPANAETLIRGISSTGLVPPGINTAGPAMLLSDDSRFSLRFRPDPLAIEVLSFPRSREDGPAVMVRIPSLNDDGTGGSVFIADRLGDINPPSPFAPLAECVSQGWIDQSFDQAEIPQAQEQQLRAWLAARRTR